MKTISFNAQLCSSKAVTGAGENNEELKATFEKFQRLLCKASVTEEELKLKKRHMKISDMLTKKTIEICVKCKLYIY